MNRPDVCDLVAISTIKDDEGYETVTENKSTVFCTWTEGVSQNEFYLSHKEGFQATASVDIITFDYNRQQLVDFNGVRYHVIRTFQRKPDIVTLILEEVVR